MKQLLHPLSSDAAFFVPARRPAFPSSCAPRAAWIGLGSDTTGLTSTKGATSPATEALFTHLGANGRMVITTDARRRPPETPT